MWNIPRRVLVLEPFLNGQSLGRYGFTKKIVAIGRNPISDLRLDHPGISRNHLRIERVGDGFVVEDCNSANGILVNSTRVRSHPLREGDELRVGKYTLRVSLRQESEYDGAGPELEFQEETLRLGGLPTVRAPHLRGNASDRPDDP